jgi:hypothetical protein
MIMAIWPTHWRRKRDHGHLSAAGGTKVPTIMDAGAARRVSVCHHMAQRPKHHDHVGAGAARVSL